ncbi:probable vacuolar amino acid transporter YPQ2 [Dioscorea cayenensis subsp. rotundata]|uniref:Probable vacuolar amino acid transporter YPQ2 n=1 Tax=Dioscorea cayennensis subsp. rotundata TaxID=55577 RepID=A0AB40C7M3_DIOCR|nr:probable vacuolar amino acid transporter YPQ2 [Dioscorea cayenensis subsp. rotundata]
MGLPLKAGPPVCPSNLHCSEWARVYLSYCLCGVKDGMSLILGLISVISWGVAEVPQIVTSYREKSTEGLSIAFLMTWIVGDLFNVTGCLLEPSTLPTQFYMALLYTATTAILTAQTIYYGHIYPRLKERRRHQFHKKQQEQGEVAKEKLLGSSTSSVAIVQDSDSGSIEDQPRAPSSPIPVSVPLHHFGSAGRDLYYNQHSTIEPLIDRLTPTQSTPPLNTKRVLCVVSSVLLLLGSLNFRIPVNNRYASAHGMVVFVSRRLLQDKAVQLAIVREGASNGIGTILGWAMAAIYMGGRLPQICLNIRRGNVEGLSPFMFVFALIGNATYVGSILVNSLEWHKIKPNLPWLVDAGGCVLLDTFILIQFAYFHYRRPKDLDGE